MNPNETPEPPKGFRIIPREWLEAGNPLPEDAIFCETQEGRWEASLLTETVICGSISCRVNTYATAQPLPCFTAPEHNPDNLTPEQYGAPEWRLLRVGDEVADTDEVWCCDNWEPMDAPLDDHELLSTSTYRRRVTAQPAECCGSAQEIIEQDGKPYPEQAAEQRIAELELALATIGDLAVVDWDDATVGKVDAMVKDPIRYRDRLRALFIDIPKQRDEALARIAELERMVGGMKDRVHSAEPFGDCPFCETYPATGARHEVPMCQMCQMEESRDTLRAERDALANELAEANRRTPPPYLETANRVLAQRGAKIASLEAERDALAKDRERLDWLLEPNMAMSITDENDGDWVLDRAEIDAAMQPLPKPPNEQ